MNDETGQFADLDQLELIAIELREDPASRRCVLQMWDSQHDLGRSGKDVPCNTIATFQCDAIGALHLTVFCRSNDILWGCYGANAVHFSFLLEYMALWIGCPVGTYSQVSVNWHGYLSTLKQVESIRPDRMNFIDNPYVDGRVHVTPLTGTVEQVDARIAALLEAADGNYLHIATLPKEPWAIIAHCMLQAHEAWRRNLGEERYTEPLNILAQADLQNDWVVAGREWIERRYAAWQKKQ